jgi:2-amino-4-hydroxy-6-hydroxymethyldihydropteridine diphosphokinase
MSKKTAYIGLGSNLGDRENFIRSAVATLSETKYIKVTRVSDIIETTPLGSANQPQYLNTVAEIETTLSAENLHKRLIDIEALLGRSRRENRRAAVTDWSPRTIDLDLLLFDGEVVKLPNLIVPHPQIHLRSFVLKGLCQLNPGLLHPVIRELVRVLAARLNGCDFVIKANMPQLISVAGIIGVGKTTLAKGLSEKLNCEVLLEPYDTNPFMPDVYAGKKELALDSQLYFLTHRIRQLNPKFLAQGRLVISDYIFDQDRIYAEQLLNTQQLELYGKIYEPLSADVIEPVLIIYMMDSSTRCLERIHGRGRPYEQRIELQFLDALSFDYEQLFAEWKTCPVIRIQISEFDCRRDSDIEHLANQVKFYVAV